jgi:hypothetical protein
MRQAAMTTVTLKVPFTFEITPANQPALTPITDETLRAAVDASLLIMELSVDPGGHVTPHVPCNGAPVDLSFDVLVRSGAREWLAGYLTCRAGGSSGVKCTEPVPLGLNPPATVDLIFRPSPVPGSRTMDIFSYWNGEIVRKDVPLTPTQ